MSKHKPAANTNPPDVDARLEAAAATGGTLGVMAEAERLAHEGALPPGFGRRSFGMTEEEAAAELKLEAEREAQREARELARERRLFTNVERAAKALVDLQVQAGEKRDAAELARTERLAKALEALGASIGHGLGRLADALAAKNNTNRG